MSVLDEVKVTKHRDGTVSLRLDHQVFSAVVSALEEARIHTEITYHKVKDTEPLAEVHAEVANAYRALSDKFAAVTDHGPSYYSAVGLAYHLEHEREHGNETSGG